MQPTFLLIHAECVNECRDAVCHLVLCPVIEGDRRESIEFFFNPEAPFCFVQSGITGAEVESFPAYREQWPEVETILKDFGLIVSSADGYSAESLCGTLGRLGVDFNPHRYCNAKSICRRSLDELSYSLDYLSHSVIGRGLESYDPVCVAERWCDIVVAAVAGLGDSSMEDFLARVRITPGVISPDGFERASMTRDYEKRKARQFDPSKVAVDARPDNPLFGMNVVFTGTLESMTRDMAREAVVKVGGFAPSSLNSSTDFLVVGNQDLRVVGEKGLSGKMKKAADMRSKGLPIEVVNEFDFLEMLAQ